MYYEGLHTEETAQKFAVESQDHRVMYSSNPDFIGKKDNELFIIDAKVETA